MTDAEYLERNLKGFESDDFLKAQFEKIIKEKKVDVVCELGTYLGGTTKQFSQMVKRVLTVEINTSYMERAQQFLKDCENIIFYLGSSTTHLPQILSKPGIIKRNLLIFIDSHWENYCPLLDELRIIKESGLKPVIAIHDFQVEGHPELEYDVWNGKPLNMDLIKDSIDLIYGKDLWEVEFNSEATGAKRGCCFIYPKV